MPAVDIEVRARPCVQRYGLRVPASEPRRALRGRAVREQADPPPVRQLILHAACIGVVAVEMTRLDTDRLETLLAIVSSVATRALIGVGDEIGEGCARVVRDELELECLAGGLERGFGLCVVPDVRSEEHTSELQSRENLV